MLRYHWFPREMIFWGTSAEIPYWWHVITQIWVTFYLDLICCLLKWIKGSASDWLCGKCASANQKRYPDLGSVNVISMEFVHSILRRYYAKCRLFSQASDPAAQRLYVLPFQAYEQPVLPVSTKRFWIKRTRIHPFQISHPLSQNQSGYILTTDCSPVCRWICSFVLWCLVTWCTTRSCSPVLVFLTLNPPWSAWLSYSSLYFHLIMR